MKWSAKIEKCIELIFAIEDENAQKAQLDAFCNMFPPGERYAAKMMAYLDNHRGSKES